MADVPPIRVASRASQASPRLRGPGLIALLAFLVPAIVFLAVVITVLVWEGSRAAEQTALQRTREIIARADGQIAQEMRGISAVVKSLTNVVIVQPHPNPDRVRLNAELFPQWVGNMVWPIDGSRAVFSAMPVEGLPEIPEHWAAMIGDRQEPVIGGADVVAGIPVVVIHQRVPNDARGLVLTIAIKPEVFREMVMVELPEGSTGALVDRDGDFIGRSLDQERRVATPATVFVREAIKQSDEGIYRGRTYEGLENITAYHTSELTGWSAHIAISNRLVDASASLATLVAVGGGVLSLALAGVLIWLVLQDARRREHTEVALAHAQRVESLGRLTGGIAHDFNNLLTVIIGGLERARTAPDPARTQAVEAALGSARQAASLTRSLMLYSRQQPLSGQTVNLNACVRDTAEVIERTLGVNYTVELEIDDAAGAVHVDTAQLASALLNLAINARDAMPDGGRVTLRTARRTVAGGSATAETPAGEYAEVSVADTGAGMAPDVARRAFEPFFTTKDVGKGTGLGLSQVDGFARQSGGTTELQTVEGAGTTVTMIFPRVADAAPDAAAATPVQVARGLRVLLVEDNPAVLEHARTLLRELGHDITASADTDAAEAALRRERFDILFSDIVLPGQVSGVDLAGRAAAIQPDIAVVLATGYARDELAGKEVAHPVVLKPYSAADVAQAFATALGARAARRASQRIILVEDEPFISLSAAETLADAGHEVVETATVAEARLRFAENPAFDAAIIDIGLPDGSGADLAAALHAQYPRLRIIIASGQMPDNLPDWAETLPKPYSPNELVAAVRRA